jgi:hypothetical protein
MYRAATGWKAGESQQGNVDLDLDAAERLEDGGATAPA